MNTVSSVELPAQSLLHDRVGSGDFLDCFAVPSNLPVRRSAEIITSFPGWAQALLTMRNVAVAPFGLLREGPETGDRIGPFPVETEDERELIAGFDDKHLDFRVSVLSVEGQVYLATWVRTHNMGGRIYLKTIMPFHVLISRNALARVRDAGENSPG